MLLLDKEKKYYKFTHKVYVWISRDLGNFSQNSYPLDFTKQANAYCGHYSKYKMSNGITQKNIPQGDSYENHYTIKKDIVLLFVIFCIVHVLVFVIHSNPHVTATGCLCGFIAVTLDNT